MAESFPQDIDTIEAAYKELSEETQRFLLEKYYTLGYRRWVDMVSNVYPAFYEKVKTVPWTAIEVYNTIKHDVPDFKFEHQQ